MAAFLLGTLIGLERQYRQRTAGLRTNVLVAVGAAVFVDMANRLTGHEGAAPWSRSVATGAVCVLPRFSAENADYLTLV